MADFDVRYTGTESDPVKLDVFQTIREVAWPGGLLLVVGAYYENYQNDGDEAPHLSTTLKNVNGYPGTYTLLTGTSGASDQIKNPAQTDPLDAPIPTQPFTAKKKRPFYFWSQGKRVTDDTPTVIHHDADPGTPDQFSYSALYTAALDLETDPTGHTSYANPPHSIPPSYQVSYFGPDEAAANAAMAAGSTGSGYPSSWYVLFSGGPPVTRIPGRPPSDAYDEPGPTIYRRKGSGLVFFNVGKVRADMEREERGFSELVMDLEVGPGSVAGSVGAGSDPMNAMIGFLALLFKKRETFAINATTGRFETVDFTGLVGGAGVEAVGPSASELGLRYRVTLNFDAIDTTGANPLSGVLTTL